MVFLLVIVIKGAIWESASGPMSYDLLKAGAGLWFNSSDSAFALRGARPRIATNKT